jgi:hypothetical protein
MGELCGRLQDRPWLVEMLRKMVNFEAVFGVRRETAVNEPTNEQAQVDVQRLSQAISETFADMNTAFAALTSIELSTFNDRSIRAFLASFDAIYTLNQDLLLDLHYIGGTMGTGSHLPGIEMQPWRNTDMGSRHLVTLQVAQVPKLDERSQPVVKLHGSTNWVDGEAKVMVIGTGKEAAIREARLLRWYHDLFQADLFAGGTRLMVIGYGFMDGHINRQLIEAARKAGLVMYLVNPQGASVFNITPNNEADQVKRGLGEIPLIGLSVRSLAETFGDGPGASSMWRPGDDVSLRSFRRFFI